MLSLPSEDSCPGPEPLAKLLLGSLGWTAIALLPGTIFAVVLACFRDFAGRPALLILVLSNQVGLLLVGFYLTRISKKRPLVQRAEAWGLAAALLAGLLAALLLAVLGLFYDVLLRLLFGAGSPTIGPWGAVRQLSPGLALLALAGGIAVGPAGEELFFRGTLFRRWLQAGRPWQGAVLSALLFAASRLDPWNLAAYAGMGLLLAGLCHLTGNLLACWSAQVLTNSLMFALLFSGYE